MCHSKSVVEPVCKCLFIFPVLCFVSFFPFFFEDNRRNKGRHADNTGPCTQYVVVFGVSALIQRNSLSQYLFLPVFLPNAVSQSIFETSPFTCVCLCVCVLFGNLIQTHTLSLPSHIRNIGHQTQTVPLYSGRHLHHFIIANC